VLDEGAVAPGGEAAAAGRAVPCPGPEDVGLLLGDADQDHALAPEQGGLGEVGLGDGLLALALLEVDDRMFWSWASCSTAATKSRVILPSSS
jgi:hypothetical protein